MNNNIKIIFIFFVFCFYRLSAQETQIFKVEDFDLKGKVKSCLVVTKYGKEEYEFDKIGRLIKSVTRYSDTDYDITRYTFSGDELKEKRTENYREGKFDPAISFGNFYTVEQTKPRLVIEKVFSYEKEFLDSYKYTYNEEGDLIAILHSGSDGENETLIEHSKKENSASEIYKLNGVIKKTVNITIDDTKNTKTELTTNYMDGIPSTAIEKVFKNKQLIAETQFNYVAEKKELVPLEKKSISYVQSGVKNKVVTLIGNTEKVHQYIYQFDNGDSGNWVKEIIAPDNLYTTRKIEYFPEESAAKPE
ncbi:hypothetical protein GH721_04370 [Kriegella sp. EG-1]|nr:hypothetical protein [Flavobacteriaceae bacterium EG-1]